MVTISPFFFSFTGSSFISSRTAVSSSVKVAAVSVSFSFFSVVFLSVIFSPPSFYYTLFLFDWIVGMQIVRHDSS